MIIGNGSYIQEPFLNTYFTEIEIGNYTCIAAGIKIVDIKHPSLTHYSLVSNYDFNEHLHCETYPKNTAMGKITVGSDVLIGAYCTLKAGVTIGDGAIIHAGSFVIKDVPPYYVYDKDRFRFGEGTVAVLLKMRWWNWPEELIRERIEDFKDVKAFVKKYENLD